jgi:UDPglucose 6-dehydrogenase
MNVCVVGLWHLGSVTAACLASLGHRVVGLDDDDDVVSGLQAGRPPVYEPGLAELVQRGREAGLLSFASDPRAALAAAEVVWITYDTPVDNDDVADVAAVVQQIEALFPHLANRAVVLVSSQLVAGCTRQLSERCAKLYSEKQIDFAYLPENLRLGAAIKVFMEPDRILVGVESERGQSVIRTLLQSFGDRILWMSIESAEMTKHALNAFLAMSVTFANELASICEQVGADAKEVERGLKSEQRIGERAYLAPGAAFAGGTLARDVQYLRKLATQHNTASALLGAIKESNDEHRHWMERKLEQCLGTLSGRRITVLGLTYKPDTDTLRRSASIELCHWLVSQRAVVSAHDPRVRNLPAELAETIRLHDTASAALEGADAAVIATPWPEYKELTAATLLAVMSRPLVLDANRFTSRALAVPTVEYHAVGTPMRPNH